MSRSALSASALFATYLLAGPLLAQSTPAQQFIEPIPLPVIGASAGAGPSGVYGTADFNKDGRLDILASSPAKATQFEYTVLYRTATER